MSLYAELKRRGVLKVGGAYVVVAWVVVQVAGLAFPAFEAPAWVLRVFILIAMLGFPIAVVMAWVLEVTPDGVRHEPSHLGNKRVFGLSAGLVALALAWYFVGQPALRGEQADTLARAEAAAPAAPAVVAPSPKSIAVLPFVNMSADTDNEYFSDGISEELLNALVRVDGLQVTSRTSSFAYKGSPHGAAAIAKELKVAHILEGSVRKSGTKVRITAQLIDATSDRHLWSETYDRELTDIFAIQDEIAKAIVAALQVELGETGAAPVVAVRADTQNMQAYDVYLKARELFIAREQLPEVVRLFERAIELDPKFARAFEGLAAACAVIRSWGYDDRDYGAMVEPAAARALELDPTLSMPWAARSMASKWMRPIDYTVVLGQLEKAIAADPRNATAVFWRGIAWIDLGYFDRAIADLDRCIALEPGYHNCRSHKAIALLFKGDEDAAFALFDRTVHDGAYISRNDHFVAPLWRRGHRTAAMLLLDANELRPGLRAAIVANLDKPGTPHPDAKALVADHLANARSAEAKSVVASRIYHWLHDFDGVAASEDVVVDQIIAWERDPPAWRNSPQMKAKLVKMGAVGYWRQHGFPPQCRAVGKDDFTCD